MTIYRGPGGTGEARTDSDVTEVRIIADEAEGYKDQAATSASAAASSASAAATAETNAETAATNAASSASAAASSASSASTSASNASTSASAASTSATNAASSASSASSSASAASTSASNAATSATSASNSASSASTSATNAANSASTATTQATNAASSATAAASSASSAATQATNAATSATAAASSATSAAASAAAAAASFDAFDDIYLGAKSSDPSVDNDGNALTTGDQYFNTSANELRVYNGSTWQAASTVGGTVTSLSVTGATTLGDASTDTVTVNGYMGVGGAGVSYAGAYVSSSALSGTDQSGIYSYVTGTSAATNSVRGIQARAATSAASFTSTNVAALWTTDAIKGAGSTITNQHGLYIADQTQGTNNYGITSLVSSGTNKWNIYASGTAQNYFAGNVGIGTISPDSYNVLGGTLAAVAGTGVSNVSIVSGASSTGNILFADGTSGDERRAGRIAYDHSVNNLYFFTNGNSLRATIDSSGNLGLGITPSAWGSTAKAIQVSTVSALWGNADSTFFSNNVYFDGSNRRYLTNGYAAEYRQADTDGKHVWKVAASGTAGNTISFTEAMTLDASGNLGIGTSSPSTRLHVVSSGNPTITLAGSDGAYTSIFNMVASGGGASVINASGGSNALILQTNSTERARIDSSGNLLVGTTSRGNVNSLSFDLDVATGTFYVSHPSTSTSGLAYAAFGHNGTTIGSITQSGTTAVAYNTTSDYRLKENVQPMIGALARVAALKPCTYTWKSAPDEIGEGFIAHELAEVCPQAVTGEKDAVNEDGSINPQSIDTSFLVATLTAAIQEQQALIASQSEIITALTARVTALESN